MNGHSITSHGTAGIALLDLEAAHANVVGPGIVTGGGMSGIMLGGGNGSVRGVTTTNNGEGIGIFSSGNSIRGNVVTGNIAGGIIAGFAESGNTIIGNFAHNNGFLDLNDINANCDSNLWRGNDFGTANPSCIN